MKKLPIGLQTLEDLRKRNGIYVDKTEHIYKMVTEAGKFFFLSRPRRFGKSLLISTFKELFKGSKQLFEGLYIYDKWVWSKKYPIIHLDFSEIEYETVEQLKDSLEKFLDDTAIRENITLDKTETRLINAKFAELIEKLHESTGQQVVVLIDEYDKPIIDNIIDKQVYDKVKRILHNFYQVIKGNDTHLKFVFMTGVSRFSGVSIFSGLNNLNDITVDERYSAICGYTQKELEMNFKDYILLLSKKLDLKYEKIIALIKEWYNGYSWDGEMSVYNPFSTLMLFDKNIFENYWFRTGTPTFLIELLKKNNQLTGIFEPIVVDDIASNSYDGGDIDTIDLLFQTGYLTIKERKIYLGVPEYTLNVANFEVKDSLVRYLLNAYSNYPLKELKGLQTTVHQQLQDLDGEGLSESIGKLFVNIPYPLHIGKEAYWHSLFLLAMNALGFDFKGEILTNKGRLDAVWKGKDFVVVCEIKYSVKKTIIKMLEEALKQIEDKKYYEAYSSKKVVLLGIAFNGKDVKCKFGKLYSKNKS